jgi:hypothetical protein
VPITDFALRPLRSRRRRDLPLVGVGVAALVGVFLLVASLTSEPARVDRLTVVNPTAYGVNVSVRSGTDDGRFLLGWAWGNDQMTIPDAADQGDTWIFTFSYAGVDAGEQEMTRAALEHDGWRLEIPSDVAERLAAAGLQPAYRDRAVPIT